MEDFSGKSWVNVFKNQTDETPRPYMIIGKERHDVGRENDQGYPVRAILEGNYFK